jgi:RND family efflux transporter MFP subunit
LPGRTFKGTVARTADALQADTRTLLVEVDVDNADGALTAGLYTTVRFEVPRARPTIVIPSEALIFTREGLQVAVFDNGTARLRTVHLAADDGAKVSIADGLQPADKVIVSPPVDLVDGAPVKVAPEAPAAPGPTAAK